MTDTADALREVPYFADLDTDSLHRLQSMSEVVELEPGTEIITEGAHSDDMFVVLEGALEVTKKYPHKTVTIAQRGPGEVIGEIAILEHGPRTATVTTVTHSRLLRTPATAVESLLEDPSVIRRMFHTVTVRLREIEAAVRRDEQLASLGRMAAQLMHELNNPAAAVGRTSELLGELYQKVGATTLSLIDIDDSLLETPPDKVPLGALARATAADRFAEFLTANSVEDLYGELAAALVGSGLEINQLEDLVENFDAGKRSRFIEWIALRAQATEMLEEVSAGARRISELVAIVKSYTFLDQAPIQTIKPTDGIEDTLLILKHQLKDIEVEFDFPDDLNMIDAPGRNLNQVWANLIENAADAMDGVGTIRISGSNSGREVIVTVTDSGPGVDPEILDRIFEPFFTTKPPGKGTGLGLHTVHNTVTRAGGSIGVDSDSGGTTFTLTFPSAGESNG